MNLQTLQQESSKKLNAQFESVDGGSCGETFVKEITEKAYTLGLRKGVEMVEEKVPEKLIAYIHEPEQMGMTDYYNKGSNDCRTEILTSINKIKNELK